MKRLLSLLVVAVVGGFSYLTYVPPVEAEPGLMPQPSPAMVMACTAGVDREGAGTLNLASSLAEPYPIKVLSGGTVIDETSAAISKAGGGRVPLTDLIAGGVVGLLIEMPTSDGAATVVQTGSWGVSAARCTEPGYTTIGIPGASTRNLESLELRLFNPYAVDAVVSISSASEAGIDSASELASVIVSARALVVRDLAVLLPLRNSLSVNIRVDEGAVHAFLAQEGGGERMLLEGVEAGNEWWAPVPVIRNIPGKLVLLSAAPVETEIEIDAATSDGSVAAAYSGTIPAEAMVQIPLEELAGVTGIRVSATGPITAALVFEDEGIRAGATLSPRLSTAWFLPGVEAAASGEMWIYNPTDVIAEVVYQHLVPGGEARLVEVPAGGVQWINVLGSRSGYMIRSTTSVVAGYTVADAEGVGFVMAEPMDEFDG